MIHTLRIRGMSLMNSLDHHEAEQATLEDRHHHEVEVVDAAEVVIEVDAVAEGEAEVDQALRQGAKSGNLPERTPFQWDRSCWGLCKLHSVVQVMQGSCAAFTVARVALLVSGNISIVLMGSMAT